MHTDIYLSYDSIKRYQKQSSFVKLLAFRCSLYHLYLYHTTARTGIISTLKWPLDVISINKHLCQP